MNHHCRNDHSLNQTESISLEYKCSIEDRIKTYKTIRCLKRHNQFCHHKRVQDTIPTLESLTNINTDQQRKESNKSDNLHKSPFNRCRKRLLTKKKRLAIITIWYLVGVQQMDRKYSPGHR